MSTDNFKTVMSGLGIDDMTFEQYHSKKKKRGLNLIIIISKALGAQISAKQLISQHIVPYTFSVVYTHIPVYIGSFKFKFT